MTANDQMNGVQANVTYKTQANPGEVLGRGGETLGFAKYESSSDATANLFTNKQNSGGMLARATASTEADRFIGTNAISEEKLGVDAEGRAIGVSLQADGVGAISKFEPPGEEAKTAFLDVDYSDPDIQKGLSDLEVADYISGQTDRHAGNIYIDPATKKVTGIDNDMAFPEVSREELQQRMEYDFKGTAGLPRQIHEDTAKKLLATDPDALADHLRNMPVPEGVEGLSDEAINGATQRLRELQTAIKTPGSGVEVVKEFNDDTYNRAVDDQRKLFNEDPMNVKYKTDFDTGTDPSAYNTSAKTSYVGALKMADRLNTLGIEKNTAAMKLNPDQHPQAIGKARKDPDVDAYTKMEAKAKMALKDSPEALTNNENLSPEVRALGKEISDLKAQMEPLEKKAAEYQKRLDKLEKPSALDKLKAFTKGGVSDAKAELREKQGNVLQQLKPMEKRMDETLQKAVEPERQAVQAVMQGKKQAAGLQQAQEQQVGPKGPDLDAEKLDAEQLDAEKLEAGGPKVDGEQPGIGGQKAEVPGVGDEGSKDIGVKEGNTKSLRAQFEAMGQKGDRGIRNKPGSVGADLPQEIGKSAGVKGPGKGVGVGNN